ncbi:hypothetical protein [Paraburkholderia aspalathi]|uniref:hypothetical protein n=1 Tax=Paraburkholderia aspalathi TaxID=1324617 RepID=UPI0038B74DAC
MSDVLADGVGSRTTMADAPGFFRFLVLTCAVVASADNNENTQEFGENLALAFDSPNLFTNRTALPTLWNNLRDWCNRQRVAGAPIRKVVLPQRGTGKYIGVTNAITFPGWRDLRRLRSLLDRRSDYRSIDNPIVAAKKLCPEIESQGGFSPAMREASDEFRKLYLAKASLLELHRFWLALQGVLLQHEPAVQGKGLVPQLELRFGAGLEDVDLQMNLVDAKGNVDPLQTLDGYPDEVLRAANQWLERRTSESKALPLSQAINRGMIPLLEVRFGVWLSCFSMPATPVRCMLLIAKKHGDFARQWRVDVLSIGENWIVAGPISARDTISLYQYLALSTDEPAPPPAQALMLVGGVKAGTGLLGRVALLPEVVVQGPGTVTLECVASDIPTFRLKLERPQVNSIEASEPLVGPYKFRLEENILPGAEPLAIEKSVAFFRDALEHVDLSAIDETRWRVPAEASTCEVALPEIKSIPPVECSTSTTGEVAARFDDFLEAVYSEGRSGWSEQELIFTIRRVLGTDVPSVWDILRSLMESAWLIPTSNLRWRARRWWLRPPTLTKLRLANGDEALLLLGSTPAATRKRFSETATATGCLVEERAGVSEFTPSLLLATGRNIQLLIEELQWAVADARSVASTTAPNCWPQDGVDESRHARVGRWDWEQGRFTNHDSLATTSVSLERFRRERGDREDLYVVAGQSRVGRYVTASRVSAISEAYRRANVPMFEWDGHCLVRLSNDGYLISALASESVVLACRSAGPALIDGRWRYVYPADAGLVTSVRSVMGNSFIKSPLELPVGGTGYLETRAFVRLRHRNIFRVRGLSLAYTRGDDR